MMRLAEDRGGNGRMKIRFGVPINSWRSRRSILGEEGMRWNRTVKREKQILFPLIVRYRVICLREKVTFS